MAKDSPCGAWAGAGHLDGGGWPEFRVFRRICFSAGLRHAFPGCRDLRSLCKSPTQRCRDDGRSVVRIRDQLRHRIMRGRRALERRWYIALGTILLMLPVAFAAHEATGVYYSKADVLFLAPGIVGCRKCPAGRPGANFAVRFGHSASFQCRRPGDRSHSTSAPLYGSGIREGHLVYIPSAGGQWQLSYNRAVITVEVVGESRRRCGDQARPDSEPDFRVRPASQQEIGIRAAVRITTELAYQHGIRSLYRRAEQ